MKILTEALLGALALGAAKATDEPTVMLYYEQWNIYGKAWCPMKLYDQTMYKGLTHVLYAFWRIDAANECRLVSPDPTADFGDSTWAFPCEVECLDLDPKNLPPAGKERGNFGCLKKLNNKSKDRHLQFGLSIGGWTLSSDFTECVKAENRPKLVGEVVKFLQEYEIFSFVDFDWEYPLGGGYEPDKGSPEDWENFLSFIDELRSELDAHNMTSAKISAAFGTSPDLILGRNRWEGHPTPMKTLCEKLDFVNLMTYDYVGTLSNTTGFVAPLYDDPTTSSDDEANVGFTTKLWTDACGADKRKLLIGLPSYAYSFQNVSEENAGVYQSSYGMGDGTWKEGENNFATGNIQPWDLELNYIPHENCTHYFHRYAHEDFLRCSGSMYPSKDMWINFDGAESWYSKAAFAKKLDVGGYMVWAAADGGLGEGFAASEIHPNKTAIPGAYDNSNYEAALDGWHGVPLKEKFVSKGIRFPADEETSTESPETSTESPETSTSPEVENCYKWVSTVWGVPNEVCEEKCRTSGGRMDSIPEECTFADFEDKDNMTPIGDCYTNWVYGYSEQYLGTYTTPSVEKSPNACQSRCQEDDECVSWLWSRKHQCLLKNNAMVQNAVDILLNTPYDVTYCTYQQNYLCSMGGFTCLVCDDSGVPSCVWASSNHIAGSKYCSPDNSVCSIGKEDTSTDGSDAQRRSRDILRSKFSLRGLRAFEEFSS